METAVRASGSLPEDHLLYAPGIKWRPRKQGDVAYWVPPAKDIRGGWPIKSITLYGSQAEMAEQCRGLWRELMDWRRGIEPGPEKFTLSWLIRRYQTDKMSPYHNVREKTRTRYDQSCRIIDATIGKRRIDAALLGGMIRQRISGEDVCRWHMMWGVPGEDGKPTKPARARHTIAMLRLLVSYAVILNVPGAAELRTGTLKVLRFPTIPARDVAPTRQQVLDIVRKALELGYPSIAITTLSQFEFTERRTHIIGTWESGQWRPGWVWQGISADWMITYYQNKIGRNQRTFDLTQTPALLALLQGIPEARRLGPVICCETTGKPWRLRHYISIFRKIARAAGIPDTIWSMDMRAGGATEASGIQGITTLDIQAAGGWADISMAARYTRDHVTRAQKVVSLRQKKASGTGGERI